MERKDELEAQVRKTSLRERLDECRTRIGKMCSEGRPPRMCIPVQWDDDDFYISTTLADAQRALDAEREKVKELVANQAEYEKCTDEQITALNQGCLDYEKQLATLQAQLRQVEGERDEWERKCRDLCQAHGALLIEHHDIKKELTTLRQLVEALPVVDGRMDVECGACYYIRSFVAGQYGIVCGLITEQSTAMAIKALLEYRATLAAQDAGKEDVSHD